ncbi:MAG: hypothetical protein AAF585_15690 [Verrucomicrobiota bacterium]
MKSSTLEDQPTGPVASEKTISLPRKVELAFPWILGIGVTIFFALAVQAISNWKGEPLSNLTRDPVDVLGGAVYVGVLSTLGIVLWGCAGAILLVGFGLTNAGHQLRRFLLWFGLGTSLLATDDAFQLHEQILPYQLGIPQNLVLLSYAFAFAAIFLCFGKKILRHTPWPLLAMAMACMAVSVGFDVFVPLADTTTYLEDVFKFGGIIFWLIYSVQTLTGQLPKLPSAEAELA